MAALSVIALSGGLDSTVLVHDLHQKGEPLMAVGTDFGASNSRRELKSARYFASKLRLPYEIIGLSGIGDIASTHGYIGALDGGDIADPDPPGEADVIVRLTGAGQANAPSGFYVNLASMSYYARLMGAERLLVGLTKDDAKNRPELQSVLDAMAALIISMEVTSETRPARSFEIDAPYLNMSKAEVIDLGDSLSVDLATTYSCYNGRTLHCGQCSACIARKQAFAEAKTDDPTWYEELPNVGRLKNWGLSTNR